MELLIQKLQILEEVLKILFLFLVLKITSNEYWTIKNIENREKYIFHILSQALLINLDLQIIWIQSI